MGMHSILDTFNLAGLKEGSIIKEINITGTIIDNENTDDESMRSVTIRARDNASIPIQNLTIGTLDNFTGNSCIISERIAKERNLVIGDTLSIIIAGQSKTLTIAALSAPDGIFYNDQKETFAMFVP